MVKRRLTSGIVGAALISLLAGAAVATPGSGASSTVVARAAFADHVDLKLRIRDGHGGRDNIHIRNAADTVMQQIRFDPGAFSGWHSHPGPVFITVTEGELTYYMYDDPSCTPHVVTKGNGFVDDGRGHMVRNESGEPAQDMSVIIAPPAPALFRGELDAPNPNCGF